MNDNIYYNQTKKMVNTLHSYLLKYISITDVVNIITSLVKTVYEPYDLQKLFLDSHDIFFNANYCESLYSSFWRKRALLFLLTVKVTRNETIYSVHECKSRLSNISIDQLFLNNKRQYFHADKIDILNFFLLLNHNVFECGHSNTLLIDNAKDNKNELFFELAWQQFIFYIQNLNDTFDFLVVIDPIHDKLICIEISIVNYLNIYKPYLKINIDLQKS